MISTFCFLESKTILSIEGKDRFSFLQGLVTQDVTKVTSCKSLYSLLLSPQGKFLYDFFIFPEDKENTKLFLMIEKERAIELLKRLTLYKLRSEVVLSLREDICLFAWWGEIKRKDFPQEKGEILFQNARILIRDPRLDSLGGFLICFPKEEGTTFLQGLDFKKESEEVYRLHLLKAGVPNGSRDMIIDKAIPLECGMEELGAIDWEKGCYMGQELTARTRYRGLVRKRLLPGVIKGNLEVPFKSRLFLAEKEVGTMCSSKQGYGLALIRLEALKNQKGTYSLCAPQQEGDDQKINPRKCFGSFEVYIPKWVQLPKSID